MVILWRIKLKANERYNVRIVSSKFKDTKHNNAEIIRLEPALIIVQDCDGKQHIYTGDMEIFADEV